MRKITVSLGFPKQQGKAIFRSRHIADSMDGNDYFPSPPVPIATLRAHIAEAEAARVAARIGGKGTAAAFLAKLAVVHGDLQALRTYVEHVANQHAEDAEAVVTSSGMSIKRSAGPKKALFSVKQLNSGCVRLDVRHPGVVSSFEWQYSTDGGKTWTDAGKSTRSRKEIRGLTPAVPHLFRYRVLIGDVQGDWCDPIALLVV